MKFSHSLSLAAFIRSIFRHRNLSAVHLVGLSLYRYSVCYNSSLNRLMVYAIVVNVLVNHS